MNRDGKRKLLDTFVCNILEEESGGNKDLIRDVLDRHRKSQPIVRIRERILRRLRSEIWECFPGTNKWDVKSSAKRPGENWKPLGYIRISEVMGGDHSAWVRMAQSIGIAKKNNKTFRWDGTPVEVVS